jgi:phosphonate transport system permease protein
LTTSLSSYPPQQISALEAVYNAAVSRRRLRFAAGLVVFVALLFLAGFGAEVAPKTFVQKIGNFSGYFDRILNSILASVSGPIPPNGSGAGSG